LLELEKPPFLPIKIGGSATKRDPFSDVARPELRQINGRVHKVHMARVDVYFQIVVYKKPFHALQGAKDGMSKDWAMLNRVMLIDVSVKFTFFWFQGLIRKVRP
jgi:hypothetical protein